MRLVLSHSRLYYILSKVFGGQRRLTFLLERGREYCIEAILTCVRLFGANVISIGTGQKCVFKDNCNFSTTNNTMKKTIQNQRGGISYAAPVCEVIDLVSETAILQASTNSFTIQKWEEENDEETITF